MLNLIKQIITTGQTPQRQHYVYARVTRPEPPLGFVSRTDPNFFYHKR